ncbi:hypothetical protein GTQ34_14525 [Muricauda sp. JGD-17]|uniref:DUF3108 domain-containing protein n=1 Tax=Flagellimonas ochracea TaxID=2696472 RepID=A0A964WYS6_9FLAO|nr:hypothetical protein [Allomuricauda ochracea]NAY93128.1 hypothetical protein [Allomuricauda ochracea]
MNLYWLGCTLLVPDMEKVLLIAVLFFFKVYGLSAQLAEVSRTDFKNRVPAEKLKYAMLQEGDSLGWTQIEYYYSDDILWFHEEVEAIFNDNVLKETLATAYNYSIHRMISTVAEIEYTGKVKRTQVEWSVDNDSLFVHSGIKDTLIAAETSHLDRSLGLFVLPKLVDSREDNVSFKQFNVLDLAFRIVYLKYEGEQILATHMGNKECAVMSFEGGMAEQTFYIDRKTHRIIRIDIPKLGWSYRLATSLPISQHQGINVD